MLPDFDVTIAICTYGDEQWREIASRAHASVGAQADVVRVHSYMGGLHDCRNEALDLVDTEWVIYLDADDELEPGYVDAMATGSADVRAPAVRYMRGGRAYPPYVPNVAGHARHACTADCLPEGNWLVIGSAVRTQMLRDVGGWRDFPWSEDWDTWLRCWRAGATLEAIPAAVYRAHVRMDSRNRGAAQATRDAAHRAIHRANFPELYAA
jgi:glycosyltransferase involved in cell wall biosynthesis